MTNWYEQAIAKFDQQLLLTYKQETYSFRTFHAQVCSLREGFLQQGVKKGDRIGLCMRNTPEFLFTLVGLWSIGVEVVLLNYRLTDTEITTLMESVRANQIVHDGKTIPGLQSLELLYKKSETPFRWANEEHNCATYMFTSGTTGVAKAAIQTFHNHLASAKHAQLNHRLLKEDNWLIALPLFHVSGLSAFFKAFVWGNSITLMEKWDAVVAFRYIHKQKISHISLVGTMLRELTPLFAIGEVKCPPSLRLVLVGGESVTTLALLQALMYELPVAHTFGMTETCSQIITLQTEDIQNKVTSVGKPLPGVHVKLMQNEQEGNEGELLVSGPMVISSYANGAGADSFCDGWFRTGDLFTKDDEGYFYFLGRKGDLYISGGENVYPKEIENVVKSLFPAMTEVAVSSIPNAKWGQAG
ncbi:MAG: AMP-binding protein, partial [Bacilli bacterium]